MNIQLTSKKITNRRAFVLLALFVATVILVTVIQDFIKTYFNESAFYLSESLIFSSIWWLFPPFFFLQYVIVQNKNIKKISLRILLIFLPILLHLFAFPFLVWLISELFYYHTYKIKQTLQYTLTEHLYKLILFYSIPIFIYEYFKNKYQSIQNLIKPDCSFDGSTYESSLIVSEGNKRINIAISDILYFTANTPYINVHIINKQYLHNETLKSIFEKVDREQFFRIHKSTIVNMRQVQFYTSRFNGDYDLTMSDNTKLRLSRNYASGFKKYYYKCISLQQNSITLQHFI